MEWNPKRAFALVAVTEIADSPARESLCQHQDGNKQQQGRGQLCSGGRIPHSVKRPHNASGKGGNTEELHRTVVR